jgi:hypothetical protein
VCTLLGVALAGCAASPDATRTQATRPIAPTTPPPTLATIAAVYNPRVVDLAVLRTPVTMLIDRPGLAADGSRTEAREKNQIEGSMQWQLPKKFSLRGDKVGQTLFWVGSNETQYWSLDVGSDEPFAVLGAHDKLTPRKVASLGLPAHPLDVLEALCVTPLEQDATSVRWGSQAGTVQVQSVAQLGVVVSRTLDAKTFEPRRVELATPAGQTLLVATLSRFRAVPVVGKAFSPAAIATQIDLLLPLEDTRLTLLLSDPQSPEAGSLRQRPFEPAALLKAHNVSQVRNLDN